MRIHVLKRKSSALEGERGRPVVNIVVVPEFRVASWGEHAACRDVVDVPIQKPSLADCGGRKEPQRHVFHQVQHRSAPGKSRSRSRTAIMRGGGGACRPAAARRRCGARRVALPRRAPSRCVASTFLFFPCLTSVPWHRCDGAAGVKTRAADHGRRTVRSLHASVLVRGGAHGGVGALAAVAHIRRHGHRGDGGDCLGDRLALSGGVARLVLLLRRGGAADRARREARNGGGGGRRARVQLSSLSLTSIDAVTAATAATTASEHLAHEAVRAGARGRARARARRTRL